MIMGMQSHQFRLRDPPFEPFLWIPLPNEGSKLRAFHAAGRHAPSRLAANGWVWAKACPLLSSHRWMCWMRPSGPRNPCCCNGPKPVHVVLEDPNTVNPRAHCLLPYGTIATRSRWITGFLSPLSTKRALPSLAPWCRVDSPALLVMCAWPLYRGSCCAIAVGPLAVVHIAHGGAHH